MSAPVGVDGTVLVAGELQHFNGPWEHPDELRKLNGVMRYARGTYDNGFALTAMAYSGKWNATSQIPLRAVESGLIGRFGNLDPTDYGEAQRFSLSGRWHETTATTATRINAYAIKSDLKLFHNFTYFLNDPVNGDQFKQSDDRVIVGANASRTYFGTAFGVRSETTLGIQTRYDDIAVGLFNTRERVTLSTVRDDRVREASAGVFGENTLRWTDWLRTTVGLRGDVYWTDVASNIAANAGRDSDAMLSPKAGLVLGPWAKTELYLNAGTGFHSNDARGTVTTIDPVSGDPAARTPFLVRSKGAEVGLRTQPWKRFLSTLSFFVLDFDSEIVFVGDAGNTEASRPSRRLGSELTFNAKIAPWLTADFSAAYTQARFREDDPDAPGRHIPGAVEGARRLVRWREGALLRTAAAHRGQQRALGGHDDRVGTPRLQVRERPDRAPRRLQPARRQGEPDRLFLRLAIAGRAGGRRRGQAFPSRGAALVPALGDHAVVADALFLRGISPRRFRRRAAPFGGWCSEVARKGAVEGGFRAVARIQSNGADGFVPRLQFDAGEIEAPVAQIADGRNLQGRGEAPG